MFSFSTPCLKWKLLVAVKYQYGFPGFAPPYSTRYTSMLARITDVTFGTTSTVQQLFTFGRINGGQTPASINQNALGYLPVFPYGQDLTGDPNTTFSVTGDSAYSYTQLRPELGPGTHTVSVQLSDQYTLPQLDADADTLLATIDPAAMAWNTLQEAFYEIFGPADAGLPAQYQYGSTGGAIPQLNAAAWSFLSLGAVSAANYYPNTYSKLISYIAMAGNYCRKTLTFDYNNNQINQSCLSGVGACSVPFKVVPPPLVPDKNTVVLIIPNCVCDS